MIHDKQSNEQKIKAKKLSCSLREEHYNNVQPCSAELPRDEEHAREILSRSFILGEKELLAIRKQQAEEYYE